MKYISARKADNKAMNNVSQEARWSGEQTIRRKTRGRDKLEHADTCT